jgi:hypothetical protein
MAFLLNASNRESRMECYLTVNEGRKACPTSWLAEVTQLYFWRVDARKSSDQNTCSNLERGRIIPLSAAFLIFYRRKASTTFD